ncbi:hypothetical protein OG786_16600 [Streptomyces sp. NBC_00101]|uniref:hypothetical protein n=1 Tax=Streptomyces sp. NBC_00101 TaxID=2975651 RepID=UPI00324749F7
MTTTEPANDWDRAVDAPHPAPDPDRPLRADCTVDRDGRMVVRLAPGAADRPRLLMRLRPPKGKPESITRMIDLEPEGPDGPEPDAPEPEGPDGPDGPAASDPQPAGTVGGSRWPARRRRAVLDPEPALEEGRWDLYYLSSPGAERIRLTPGTRDLRALLADRDPARTPLPLAVRVPYATGDGFLAVRTWLRPAHAEAGRVEADAASTTVRVRLFGAEPGEGSAALLRLRGKPGEVRETALTVDGPHDVSFSFAQRELVSIPGDGPGIWDVLVRTSATARPIRVARLLDDVADRKKVFVYPPVTLNGLTARTYYTLDNEMSVEVTTA